MARRKRIPDAGLIFHVLNRGAKRSKLFDNTDEYDTFAHLLQAASLRFEVAVFAYCLMPNHWHLVASPRVHGSLSRCMHWLTTTHARRWQIIRAAEGEGAVYQGRFQAIAIKGDRHFLWVCRYVERNAARARLVERAEDWPWSSASVVGAHRGIAEWPCQRPSGWRDFLNTSQAEGELRQFRQAMRLGRPFGDDEWARRVFGPRSKSASLPQEMTPDPITFL